MPESIQAGRPVTVNLRHTLENSLGEQLVHVTLKVGPAAKRVDRRVVKVGEGVIEVTFGVPTSLSGKVVNFAAFIGKDFASNSQHLQTSRVAVR